MGTNKKPVSQRTRPSFIEEARRRQIVETAIGTIALRGSSQTTLADIAREAGISKGVISYHFDGKDELIREVLACLVTEPAAFIKDRVDRERSALGRVRAYVESFFQFMLEHRSHYVALVDLWGSSGVSEGREQFNIEAYEPSRRYLVKILEGGTAAGEIRTVGAGTMASVIQASIDGVMLQWVFDPASVDVQACRDEILEMVARHLSETRDTTCRRPDGPVRGSADNPPTGHGKRGPA